MVYLNLKQQRAKELHLETDIKESIQMKLESTFTFSVNYKEDNSQCIACLHQELKNKTSPQLFRAVVEWLGYFDCEGIKTEEDKKAAHVQAYTLLFPYVQNKIAELAKDAGVDQRVMIEMNKFRPEDIKFEQKG